MGTGCAVCAADFVGIKYRRGVGNTSHDWVTISVTPTMGYGCGVCAADFVVIKCCGGGEIDHMIG
jgi:hypothetical protein